MAGAARLRTGQPAASIPIIRVQKDAGRTAMADGRTMNGVDRRGLIAAMAGALLPVSGWARTRGGYAALPFDNGERPLVRYPQKRALIGLTTRPPQLEPPLALDRKRVVEGKSVSVRVDLGGRRIIKKKTKQTNTT